MPANKIYRFEGVLERFPGKGGMYYIRFPYSVEDHFGTKGSVRVTGRLNDIPMDRALIPRGDETHHLLINISLRRQAGLRLGNKVQVTLQQNERPDELILPEELVLALEMEPGALEAFESKKPGVRRSIAYWVDSAKRVETRAQRAGEMLRRLMAGEI